MLSSHALRLPPALTKRVSAKGYCLLAGIWKLSVSVWKLPVSEAYTSNMDSAQGHPQRPSWEISVDRDIPGSLHRPDIYPSFLLGPVYGFVYVPKSGEHGFGASLLLICY